MGNALCGPKTTFHTSMSRTITPTKNSIRNGLEWSLMTTSHTLGGLDAYLKVFTNPEPYKVKVTSLPVCRETRRAEKSDRYFDFEQLTLYAIIDISFLTI